MFHPLIKPTRRIRIQTKLQIGQPNDRYEKEADAVADRVMTMPNSHNAISLLREEEGASIQLKCAQCEEEEKLQMQPLEEEEEEIQMQSIGEEEEEIQMKPVIQLKSNGARHASSELAQKIAGTKGGGKLLPKSVKAEMGNKIGADFSGVRIHNNSHAHQMNTALGAQAFTHGKDIYFNSGKYNPSNSEGKHLLAHELTHVIQQSGGRHEAAKSKTLQPLIQRAIQVPAGVLVALAAIGRFLLGCIIGAAFGVGLDYVWQRGVAWWNEQTFRWNTCMAAVSAIIGCVTAGAGSLIARAIFRYTGGHLERDFAVKAVVWLLTWLYSKFPVVPIGIILKFLVGQGCVEESEVPSGIIEETTS